jgi:hypothetical protein
MNLRVAMFISSTNSVRYRAARLGATGGPPFGEYGGAGIRILAAWLDTHASARPTQPKYVLEPNTDAPCMDVDHCDCIMD